MKLLCSTVADTRVFSYRNSCIAIVKPHLFPREISKENALGQCSTVHNVACDQFSSKHLSLSQNGILCFMTLVYSSETPPWIYHCSSLSSLTLFVCVVLTRRVWQWSHFIEFHLGKSDSTTHISRGHH